jgi:hypothetical protein
MLTNKLGKMNSLNSQQAQDSGSKHPKVKATNGDDK